MKAWELRSPNPYQNLGDQIGTPQRHKSWMDYAMGECRTIRPLMEIKMPYTSKQHKLFEAAANSKSVAKKSGIPQSTAKKMASEGVKQGKSKSK